MNNQPWRISRRTLLRYGAGLAAGTSLLSLSCAPGPGGPSVPASFPIRFGIVTDCHYADTDTVGTRFYRESLAKLSECVAQMRAEHVTFLIELGDLKDQGQPPCEDQTLEYLQSIEAVFRGFEGPRYHVLGNHDVDSISKQQFLRHISNTGIDPGRNYYSFDLWGVHFIVLDANYTADGRDYDHGNFDWTDANIPPHELDWLQENLATCRGSAIVFVHQRLDGTGPVYVKNAAEVCRILEGSGKVPAVFQGHHHEGGYSRLSGIHYYTLPAVVEGHGIDNNSYAIVEVYPHQGLTVAGYRRAPSMGLGHIIRRSSPGKPALDPEGRRTAGLRVGV
jgi:hypothetical protein